MITPSRIADLPADERAELAAILAEARGKKYPTERFQSNADEASFVFYLLVAGCIGGLIAYVVVFGNPFAAVDQLGALALLAIPVGAYSLWRIIANFRGNGWALTSFGLVHVIRTRVRIVRFSDVVRVELHRFKYGSGRRRATSIKLITRDGTSMHCYAGALLDALVVRLPAEAQVVET